MVLNNLLIIPLAAICRRFKGGGILNETKYNLAVVRHIGSPIFFAIGVLLLSYFDWKLALIAGLGFALMDIVGTGDMFAAVHGGYDGVRKYSIWNRWIYHLSDRYVGVPTKSPFEPELRTIQSRENALWGTYFATLRGIYKLPTTLALGSFWGLLGLLDGPIYFISGRIGYYTGLSSVAIAEYTSTTLYGLAIYLSI